MDFQIRLGMFQGLRIRVGDDEFDAFQVGANHIVDGVATGATDAYDHDPRLKISIRLGCLEVNAHIRLLRAMVSNSRTGFVKRDS